MPVKNTSAPRQRASAASSDSRRLALQRMLWFIGLCAWAAAAASLLSFSPADPPSHAFAPHPAGILISNWMGPAGAFVAYQSFLMLGSGAWILLIAAGVYLALVAFKGGVTHIPVRTIGVIMVALAFSGFHALLMPSASAFPEGAGGLAAIAGVHELVVRFGALGAGLWLTLMAVVGLTVAFDDWFAAVSRMVARPVEALLRMGPALAGVGGVIGRAWPPSAGSARPNDVDDDRKLCSVAARIRPTLAPAADEDVEREEAAEPEDKIEAPPTRARRAAETRVHPGAKRAGPDAESVDDAAEDETEIESPSAEASQDEPDALEPESAREFTSEELRQKIAKLPVLFAGSERRAATQEDLDLLRSERSNEAADQNYVFPSLDVLVNPDDGYEEELDEYVREQATALESALHTYNIKGGVAGIESGPVITLYQVRLAPGTKVSAISAVSSDIARALKSVNIRVVPNTEGLDTVGIEVPNRKKEKVRLKELMTRSEATSKMKLPLFLGKDAAGKPLIIDLATLPHMLIAGTTGSGKSVCMNAIIMGFLYTQKPSDMKLVLVDPKMVELSQFKDIPHLMCPVVTDMSKAAAILEWAVGKMDERYELLAEAGCRDIGAYNNLTWEEKKERFGPQSESEEARIPRKLPYMVFIIDELADLIMTNKEVEGSIVRIAQKARAVGIHLILATQRPQANVVTGLIKSNMPGRIAFKVASGMDSRIVLDQKGGELLLGQGDMLFITPRSATPMRAQGTLVDDSEIRSVVRFVKTISAPSFERQLVQLRSPIEPGSEDHEQRMLDNAQEDPLFDRAVEIVLETRRGSVSLLQRRLAIGYTRASRLIELMGMAGIIGGHKGSVAREVTMTIEEWHAMKKQAEMDAAEATAAKPPLSNIAPQAKLFPEPVTAREIIESKKAAEPEEPPPFDDSPAAHYVASIEEEEPEPVAPESAVIAPVVTVAPIGEMEEEEEEEEEAESPAAAEVEDETTDEDDVAAEPGDAAAESDEDYEYEYEYVEVEDGAELSDEYEVVEEEPATPEIVVKPQARTEAKEAAE